MIVLVINCIKLGKVPFSARFEVDDQSATAAPFSLTMCEPKETSISSLKHENVCKKGRKAASKHACTVYTFICQSNKNLKLQHKS